jgi:hypothetical protein
LILGLAVLAMLVMDFNRRTEELRRLTGDREQVGVQVTALVETKGALEAQMAYATSQPAVEEWAYTDGHMVRPGDNPVVPFSSGQVTPTPTATEAPAPTPLSNWQRWLTLFTGPKRSP